jgi:hypothetical protein
MIIEVSTIFGEKMRKVQKGCPTSGISEKPSSASSLLARQEFKSLEKWLYSEDVSNMSLRGVELGEELRGRELLRLLLQSHIEARGNGDVGANIKVFEANTQAALYTHKRIHQRKIVTLFGEICVNRIGYGKRGKASIHPLDEKLQLPTRCYSYELQRRVVKKAVQGPFDEAIEALCEATGEKMPKRIAEDIVIDASESFDSFYACRKGADKLQDGTLLIGSVDCKGIPMIKSELAVKKVRQGKGEKAQQKKMATVAAVFMQKPRIRTPEEVVESLFNPDATDRKKWDKTYRPERKRVWASLEVGKDAFISDVKEEMQRRDPKGEKIRAVVTDGERALQIRVSRIIKDAIVILDLIHALEKLWVAGHALYGEGTDKAEQFVRARALRILRGEVSQVVKGLRLMVTKRNLKGSRKEKLCSVAKYLYNNRSRMRYDVYLAKGLPIASGSVEGVCKNLIKDRMERSGMRWSEKMAEAMVKMRAVYLSHDFDEYWDFHIQQEQNRLYPKNRWKPTKPSS